MSIEAPVFTWGGDEEVRVQLPENLFALPWSDRLVHQVVVSTASNQRSATAHTKGRSEVRGGGRKPWRQKGTGRARHGSVRSPLWVGGGVTFGPSRDKNYRKTINKKMRTKAFFVVLSQKLRSDSLAFINDLKMDVFSTKTAVSCIEKVCGTLIRGKKNICTIVLSENNTIVRKSFSNIPGVRTVALEAFNVRDALTARKIFFVDSEKTLDYLHVRGGVGGT